MTTKLLDIKCIAQFADVLTLGNVKGHDEHSLPALIIHRLSRSSNKIASVLQTTFKVLK